VDVTESMLVTIATLISMLLMILLPVVVPAVITGFHTIAAR
jgi:hypothetical protein